MEMGDAFLPLTQIFYQSSNKYSHYNTIFIDGAQIMRNQFTTIETYKRVGSC